MLHSSNDVQKIFMNFSRNAFKILIILFVVHIAVD